MKTPLQTKVMEVTHELPSKIASYQGLPQVTSKINKIWSLNQFFSV